MQCSRCLGFPVYVKARGYCYSMELIKYSTDQRNVRSVWPHLFVVLVIRKEGRPVEVVHGIYCMLLEVFHVHSYQDQFIHPG